MSVGSGNPEPEGGQQQSIHDEALLAVTTLRRTLGQMDFPSPLGGVVMASDLFLGYFDAVERTVADHRRSLARRSLTGVEATIRDALAERLAQRLWSEDPDNVLPPSTWKDAPRCLCPDHLRAVRPDCPVHGLDATIGGDRG